jgi:ribosomal protein S12 methylthiotransferase
MNPSEYSMNRPKVALITLGCSKNLVDSEKMLGLLEANGYQLSSEQEADLIVVNTCGFIQPAKEESIETVLEAARLKEDDRAKKLIVTGCLVQRYQRQLEQQLPEADLLLGLADESQIVQHCDRLLGLRRAELHQAERRILTPSHYAYLRIADGCDNWCSYCTIPLIRGRQRSRPIEEVTAEAGHLVRQGARELILIAQDTTKYGTDLYGKRRVDELIRELAKIEGVEWLRLLYTHPAHWWDGLIDVLAETPKVCRCLDIPLQHISDGILTEMNRRITRKQIVQLIQKLRERLPGVALRTSVMVGFPGETDQEFRELLDFLRQVRFQRLGTFSYWREEGTQAAEFARQVPQKVKEERLHQVMLLQQKISLEFNRSLVGEVLPVLIDQQADTFPVQFVGRTQLSAPEVDGQVLITEGQGQVGRFCKVKIAKAYEYDIAGEIVSVG